MVSHASAPDSKRRRRNEYNHASPQELQDPPLGELFYGAVLHHPDIEAAQKSIFSRRGLDGFDYQTYMNLHSQTSRGPFDDCDKYMATMFANINPNRCKG